MSDSPGGGWSQSPAPFQGMTAPPFALRTGVFHFDARSSVRAGARKRRRKARGDGQQRTNIMTKAFSDILQGLRTSAVEILQSDASDREQLLTKSFEQAEAALGEELVKVAPVGPDEADYITVFADRVVELQAVAEAIEGGACQKMADADPTEGVVLLLKSYAALGNVVLAALAAEHVAEVAEGEDLAKAEGAGLQLLKFGDEQDEILLKTTLPEDLHVLIADPAEIEGGLVEAATDLLAFAGVTPADLAKAFPPPKKKKGPPAAEGDEGEEGPPRKGPPQAEGDEPDGDEGQGGEGDGDGDEDGDFEDGEGDEGFEDDTGMADDDPIEAIAKLGSMILVQVDAVKGAVGGGDAGPMPAEGGGLSAIDAIGQHAALIVVQADAISRAMGAPDAAEGMNPQPDTGVPGNASDQLERAEKPEGEALNKGEAQAESAEKPAGEAQGAVAAEGTLEKSAAQVLEEQLAKAREEADARVAAAEAEHKAAMEKLAKAEAERNEALEKLQRQPAEAKAVLQPESLTKAGDMTINQGKGDAPVVTPEALAKMSESQRTLTLMKMAQKNPQPFRP